MQEQAEWCFFRNIDWEDELNNKFWIDTRDFCCGYKFDSEPHKNFVKILNDKRKHSKYFFTKDELVELFERYYSESGGESEWRCFNLKHTSKRVTNWEMKYIRIMRTDFGYIVCNSEWIPIKKDVLASEVDKEFL